MTTAAATDYAFRSGNVARWERHRSNPIQRTPDRFFEKLDAEFGFTLDAAASDANAKCARYFTREDDALGQDWGTERVWCNPPFGRGLAHWARKAWEASRSGALVVLLVPSSTDLDWWAERRWVALLPNAMGRAAKYFGSREEAEAYLDARLEAAA